jgi:hypothetical protein
MAKPILINQPIPTVEEVARLSKIPAKRLKLLTQMTQDNIAQVEGHTVSSSISKQRRRHASVRNHKKSGTA